MLVLPACLGFGVADSAFELVRDGIAKYSGGDFQAAAEAFEKADEFDALNPRILFDQACAKAALGETDKARDLYLQAALGRDTSVVVESHFNLGCLSVEQGREVLGENPVEVETEKREEAIKHLLTAVGHFRDCIRFDASHDDARHNLELIRLFIKHIQAEWEKRDREKARQEMSLLEFLAMIEQKQSGLRSAVRMLEDESASPQQRQAIEEAGSQQLELKDEIEPLKEKITAELQPAQQPPGTNAPTPDPNQTDQSEQVRKLLHQLADEAASKMLKASETIDANDLASAQTEQLKALDRLNDIYMAIAPYPNILQRSIKEQQGLVTQSEELNAVAESKTDDAETTDAKPSDDEPDPTQNSDDAERYFDLARQQSRICDWSRILNLKAQSELPTVTSQLEAAETQKAQQVPNQTEADKSDNEKQTDDEDEAAGKQPSPPDPTAQLSALKESMEKAVELAPKVVEHSESAVAALQQTDSDRALPDQQEALKLLKEIAKPLEDQQKQDEKNDQQQDNKNNQDQKQNKKQQDQQNKQDQQQKQQKQQQQKSKQSPQERAISALRRAREREQKHRDLQKQLQRIIGGRVRVKRDW